MKIGDLVVCKRAYGAKGIIIDIRDEMYYTDQVCDVWLYELEPQGDEKVIYTFMKSQLEVINEKG